MSQRHRKSTTFTLDEQDMARLQRLTNELGIKRSRVISLAISLLNTVTERYFPEAEKSYADIVLSKAQREFVDHPPDIPVQHKAKRGWPKGVKRGPRKNKISPLLRLVEGGNKKGFRLEDDS